MSTMARLKKLFTLYLDPKLLARLEAWLSRQDVPPSRTAVVEAALREFLEKREKGRKA
jgi:metal-responsive CopG/Arc/MetJ family transcriptional regulator